MPFTPQDQSARDAAERSLNETTFIAAGAGTGKTTTIVKRIVNALCDSNSSLSIRNLVAITFTERAAAELRRRIRSALQDQAARGSDKAKAALVDFDTAQIGTIHAFAKRILSRFPIEAGLPLTFQVLDEATSKLSLRDTASRFVADFFGSLDNDSKSRLAAAGISPVVFRDFFIELNSKRLLVNVHDVVSERQVDPAALAGEFIDQLMMWFEDQRSVWEGFSPSFTGKIDSGLLEISNIFQETNKPFSERIGPLQKALYSLLHPGNSGGAAAKAFRDEIKDLFDGGLDGLEFSDVENFIRQKLPAIWGSLQDVVAKRIALGRLTFDDLIALSSELIEKNPDVRGMLHREFKLLVVDEFQDTDPLQWKLISLITTPLGESAPERGSLVLVGDAQQSIYSFRGADVATYLAVADRVGTAPMGGIRESLEVNFRSNQKILNWVNATFSHCSIELGTDFVNLLTAEKNLVPEAHAPGVSVLGGPDVAIDYSEESSYIASAAHQAVAQGWKVTSDEADNGAAPFKNAKYSDIVILIPARTSLEDLLEELSIREVPYRSNDSAIVFDRPAVRGLIDSMKVVAGIEQPLDLWFALKSPLFGCDDFELLEYKKLGGRWVLPYGEASEGLSSTRVYQSLAKLAKVRRTSSSSTPAAIMMQLLEETEVMSAYDRTPRGRFEIECVQMVLRQARSWAQAGGVGAVEYLTWIKDQLSENARETLPETDDLADDAVRISTVHGVKGLEFPIVILGGMGRKRITPLPTISVKLNRFEFNLGQMKSYGYIRESRKLELADLSAEQTRVLYVAATRARDHLLVSNLAKETLSGETQSWSGLYREAVAASVESGLASRFDSYIHPVSEPKLVVQPKCARETSEWLAMLPEIRSRSKIKNLVTPSSLGLKESTVQPLVVIELVDDTYQAQVDYQGEGIVGADVAKLGNAFHQVMEFAIQTEAVEVGDLLPAISDSLVEYDVPEHEERLVKMVSNLFEHEVMERIRSADRVFPELAISEINDSGVLVEGFADLVIEESGSLVILDYKTNLELSTDKIEVYSRQLDLYAQIIQRATKAIVREKLLLHVTPEKVELVAV